MELQQSQKLQLNQRQLQGLLILQMSSLELEQYLSELSLENPVIELESNTMSVDSSDEEFIQKLHWLEENDQQNMFFFQNDKEEIDSLTMYQTDGGLTETLYRSLTRQLGCLKLEPNIELVVCYLAACLDDDGYLRISPEEVQEYSGFSAEQIQSALAVLKSLEPAGIGAANLSECLTLQLYRLGAEPVVLAIVKDYLNLLACNNYNAIAKKLHITETDVLRAQQLICKLDPRPGAVFQSTQQVQYIRPDVCISEECGHLSALLANDSQPPFTVNRYYQKLFKDSKDPEVHEYLRAKISQAESILRTIEQRNATLLRCAESILRHQMPFFKDGPESLKPLRMIDIAQELDLHVSTVSRTLRMKYLQCSFGIFPMSYFFPRSVAEDNKIGYNTACALLRHLIDNEDKTAPLSDQSLCVIMAQNGCVLSRRTVAKYRSEMNIPNALGRKKPPNN